MGNIVSRREVAAAVLCLSAIILVTQTHLGAESGLALPNHTGQMVNDWAYLLTSDEVQSLEHRLRDIEKETTVEIYIVTTEDLEGKDLNTYSYMLFNAWGIGKKDVNNGLLLTLYYKDINESYFDYEFRIEVGRGLEANITDSKAGRIVRDDMAVWFDDYEFFTGFDEGVSALYQQFKDDPAVISGQKPMGLVKLQFWAYENPMLAGILIGFALLFCFSLLRGGIPFILPTIALLLFAWWLDSTFSVLLYALAVAFGGGILFGASRKRSGGGRSDGGGYSYD